MSGGKSKLHPWRHDRDSRASDGRGREEEQVDLAAPPTRQIDWTQEIDALASALRESEAEAGH